MFCHCVNHIPRIPYTTLLSIYGKARRSAPVALAYRPDSHWRNRSTFLHGRAAIEAFLTRKWQTEHDYRLIKDLWAFDGHRIAVRFAYEWPDDAGHWYRSYGNESRQLDADGLMALRLASLNDVAIAETQRLFYWQRYDTGHRPDGHPVLEDLQL